MTIEHPRYDDGKPVHLGDRVRLRRPAWPGPYPDRDGYREGIVTEITHVDHCDEVWISTDTGKSIIFHAEDLELVE